MAQYLHRVIFGTPPDARTYVVRANDSGQAVRRAMREHEGEHGCRPSPQDGIKVRSLTPKKVDGKFYPRVGGRVIDGGPCATEQQALDIAINQSLSIMQRMQP